MEHPMDNALVPLTDQARVNVTYAGRNFDLDYPIPAASTDAQVLASVRETANIHDLDGFVVDRKAPDEVYPFARFIVRPGVSFGA